MFCSEFSSTLLVTFALLGTPTEGYQKSGTVRFAILVPFTNSDNGNGHNCIPYRSVETSHKVASCLVVVDEVFFVFFGLKMGLICTDSFLDLIIKIHNNSAYMQTPHLGSTSFLSGPLSSKMISIQFRLAVWFCSGQELPVRPCSLAWIRAGRAVITPKTKPYAPKHKLIVKIFFFLIEWLIIS